MLEVIQVSKKFHDQYVLHDINVKINAGGVHAFLGQSGSGKSRLLSLMVGLQKPTKGKVLLFGKEVSANDTQKNLFGFVAQETSFYQELTVMENLQYLASLFGLEGKHQTYNINAVLALMHLQGKENIRPVLLSKGFQKRLDIACSLVHGPAFLVMDEPFAGIDISFQHDLCEILKQIKNKGTTVILATHFVEEIAPIVDEVFILHDQKLKFHDEYKNIHKKGYSLAQIFEELTATRKKMDEK